MERLELLDGVGPELLTIVNAVDEELPPIVELLSPWLDPVRHDGVRLRRCGVSFGAGEVAALVDGGKVGPVVGEDAVEDVASLGEVVVLGDDVDPVLVPASGGGHVQPAMGGGGGGEGDAHVDGVALMPVFSRGVAEPDVLGDVLGREGDGPAALPGDGERSVGVGGGDGPGVAVAHGLIRAGGERAVVATGHDDLTDMSPLVSGDRDGAGGIELPGVESGVLDAVVQCVDVLVAAGRDRHRSPRARQGKPVDGDAVQVLIERAGQDAAMVLVCVEGGRLAGAQLQ